MLSFALQLEILKTLVPTYVDDRRIELNSKQFSVDNDTFVFNMVYLKKEKLIDLSSLNTKTLSAPLLNSDEPELVKPFSNEPFAIARCNLSHLGMKALCSNSNIKFIQG